MERITVTIDGNSTGLEKALKSAENRLNSFNERLTKNSRALTDMFKRITEASAGFSAYNASVASMTAANNRAATSLTNLAAKVNSTAVAQRRLAVATRQSTATKQSLNIGVKDLIMGFTSLNTLIYTTSFIFGGVVKSTIDANAKFEKMNVLLKNVSTNSIGAMRALEGKDNLNFLYDLGDKVPFKIDELSKAFVKLKANGIDPTNGSLRGLTDAISYFGGGSEELTRASTAISQMISKGTVQMEDLKGQLAETGGIPSAIKDMAKAAGFAEDNMKGFYKAMKDGAVDSSTVIPKFFEILEQKYGGAGSKMMNTWDGLMSRMGNSWSKMLVRVTSFGGDSGFFNVLKKNVSDLLTFMNSKQGDDFAVKLSKGIGTAISAVSDLIKWLYRNREAIIAVGSAFAKLFIFQKGMSLFKDLGIAAFGLGKNLYNLVMIGPRVVAVIRAIAAAETGAAVIQAAFGANLVATMTKLNLFNKDLTISRGALMALAAPYAIIAAAAVALGAAYLYGRNKQAESTQESARHVVAQNEIEIAQDKAKTAIAQLNEAKGDEIQKSKDLIIQLQKEARQQIATATTAANAAKAKLVSAGTEYAKYAPDKNPGGLWGNLKAAGSIAGKVLGGGLSGFAQSKYALNRAETDFNEREAERAAKMKVLDDLVGGLVTYNFKGAGNGAAPTSHSSAGTGGKTNSGKSDAEKEADKAQRALETQQQRWVNLKVKADELAWTIEKGTSEGFDTEVSQDAAEEAVKLLGGIERVKTGINGLKDANREATLEVAHRNVITQLSADVEEARAKTQQGFNAYIRGFESVADKVAAFEADLKAKNSKTLNDLGGDENTLRRKRELLVAIGSATEEYRKQTITGLATEYRNKSREITNSLLTERDVRQANYDLEVTQVEDLLSKLSGKSVEEMKMATDINQYLENLSVQKRFADAGPIAGWSRDAQDLKANLQDTLPNIMDGFADQLADGKANFADFAKSMIADITKIIIKAFIAKAILSALGLGGYGDGGALPTGIGNSGFATNTTIGYQQIATPTFHTGGEVGGKSGGMFRNINPAIFDFAQRYHTGGFPGLKSNEVPIIAEKGEGVFTKSQMRALGGRNGSNGSDGAAPTVNIINQTSRPVEQESTAPRFDGEKWVVDILLKHGSKPGPVRDMMMSK